jgi:CDP-diacylglycerol--serine O-phosphatidyltransferase
MQRIAIYIPNTITCFNLVAGCLSCVMAFQGNYLMASLFVYIAAVFDFLDGMAARLLKAYSNIGRELDSLADMISFGMAPGFILFSWLKEILPADMDYLSYIAFLIPVFSALRLAKFNIDIRQASSFIGLPTPANAIFIASLISLNHHPYLESILQNSWVITGLVILLSFLLVSRLPMFSLKFKSLRWKDNQVRYIFLILSLLLILTFHLIALPLIIILFIVISLFLKLRKKLVNK